MATFEIIGASSGGGGSPAGYAAGYPDGTKIYMALLTQSGTDAPVATVLMNTLGGTVVWTRSLGGVYLATLAGVFLAAKTWFTPAFGSDGVTMGSSDILKFVRTSDNVMTLTTTADDYLNGFPIQIIVFP